VFSWFFQQAQAAAHRGRLFRKVWSGVDGCQPWSPSAALWSRPC